MKKTKFLLFLIFILFGFSAKSFPIPKNGEVSFDIIRKNKVIGVHEIKFEKLNDSIIVETNIDIKVKILFIPAYKFSHNSKETWIDDNLIKIEGYTDFEDEREYYIKGEDKDELFLASGMDGKLELDSNILSSNFWNINILKEKEIFDTQKGILRTIKVKNLGHETIIWEDKEIKCKKFTLNASSNPKDKGPFPEYTLWYAENDELIKFKFKNWKDKKVVTLIRNNQENN